LQCRRPRVLALVALSMLLGCTKTGDSGVDVARGLGFVTQPSGPAKSSLALQLQEQTAVCMRNAGFKYFVYLPKTPPSSTRGADSLAASAGYGISTSVNLSDPLDRRNNQNLGYVEKLSPEVRKAYSQALVGDGRTSSCLESASKAVPAEIFRLQSEFNDGVRKIDLSAEVLRAQKAWMACMGQSGFLPPAPGWLNYFASKTQSLIGGAEVADPTFPSGRRLVEANLDRDALGKVQSEEISVAVADRSCTKRHLSQRQTLIDLYSKEFQSSHFSALKRAGKFLRDRQ
jgi:hypothetical protein